MSMDPIQTAKQDRHLLVKELENAGARFRGRECTCPFHEDKRASAGVYQDGEGTWRFKCQSVDCGVGGDIHDIRAKLTGRPLAEVLRDARGTQQRRTPAYPSIECLEASLPGQIVSRHIYGDRLGNEIMRVYRVTIDNKKSYRPAHPVNDGWSLTSPPQPWPIYAMPEIAQAAKVVIVEGERCSDALNRLGIPSTTSPSGAGKAHLADWSALAGKSVTLWPDNDDPGKVHMQQVKGILERLQPPANVSWIDPTGLSLDHKGDVADLAERLRSSGKTVAEIAVTIREVIDSASYTGPLSDLDEEMTAVADGRIRTIPWPWSMLSDFTESLSPGKLTLVSGAPGSGKSLFILQCVEWWLEHGETVAFFCLEGTRNDHLRRGLAHLAGASGITKNGWLRHNIAQVLANRQKYAVELDRLTSAIETNDSCSAETLEQIADWIRAQAKAGKRIVAVDPVTLAERTDQPWVSDKKFVREAGRIAREFGASIILVTHPDRGAQNAELGNVAGGAAYQRFSDTIIAISKHETQIADVRAETGTEPGCQYNQTIRLVKARYAEGGTLAFEFDPETLRTEEKGLVVKKRKDS